MLRAERLKEEYKKGTKRNGAWNFWRKK